MNSKLYIGNLPFTTTEDELSHHFSGAGEVLSARIITDRVTGRSKGFGFLEMSSNDQAQDAIEQFDGSDFGGRSIRVSVARERERQRMNGHMDHRRGGQGFSRGQNRHFE